MKNKPLLLLLILMLFLTDVAIGFQTSDESDQMLSSLDSNHSGLPGKENMQSMRIESNGQTQKKKVPIVNSHDKSDPIPRINTNSLGGGGGQISVLAIPTYIEDYNTTSHQIIGILKGFGNDFWDGETVTLYRTTDIAKNITLDTALNSEITGDPVTYENIASVVTGSGGEFNFTFSYVPGDIDDWIYFVFFAGQLIRGEGLVYKEFLTIQDIAEINVSVNKDSVGTTQTYQYTIHGTSLAFGSNLAGLDVQFNETYIHGPNGNNLDNALATMDGSGNAYKSTIYGSTGNWGTFDNDNVTLTIGFPFGYAVRPTRLPSSLVNESIVSASNRFIFNVNTTVDGVQIAKFNSSNRYHRLGQNVTFVGQLVNTTIIGNGTAQELKDSISGNDTSIFISGWTGSTLPTLFTNDTGWITFSFLFNKTNFPNLSTSGNSLFRIRFNIFGAQLVADRFEYYYLFPKENISSITATTDSPNAFYHPGSDSIIVEGQVFDSDGNGAALVALDLNINNKVASNDSWGTVTNYTLGLYSAVTNGTGHFTITVSDFNFNFTSPQITLNLTISDIQTNLDWNATKLNLTSFEPLTINYYSSILTQIEIDLQDGNGFQLINGTMEVFNETFVEYYNNNVIYRISITDQYLRNATGLIANVTGPDGTLSFVVTADQSNFTFSIANVTNFNQALFNTANSTFSYGIVIANGLSQLEVIYTDTFILFGPDNSAPGLIGSPNHPSDEDLEKLVFGENVTILVNIDTSKSALDNIQYVILYYMLSTNTPVDLVDAIFPLNYVSILMIYQGGVIYQQNVTFFEHGTWVRYYIEIVDYAGYGLIGRYTSNSTNLPLGYTNYTTSFTNNFTTTPTEFKMGDNEIFVDNPLNLVTSVTINGTALDQVTDTSPYENIQIDLYLPQDNLIGDYLNVTISYEIRIYDVDGHLLSSIPFVNETMNQLGWISGIQKYWYQYVINGSSFDYFYEINYLFHIYDQSENLYETEDIITAISNDPNPAYSNTEVADNDNPEIPILDLQFEETPERNNTLTIKQVYNQTEIGSIAYNITDVGIGIGNIYLSIFYYYPNGTLRIEVSLMLVENGTIILAQTKINFPQEILLWLSQISNNGTLVNVTETNGFYYIGFEIDFSELPINSTVSWELGVTDIAGNEITLNSQGQDFDLDPMRFSVIHPPIEIIPDIDVTQTVVVSTITDADGNTIVITSTIQLFPDEEKDSGNALLIILVFSVLLFGLTLYYQRHNIKEYFERSARKRKAKSTLSELIDEIKRLGAEERYKSAIKLVWEALERLSKEILQVPRSSTQTAREFASYLSTVTIVDRETLITISNAFESAKYGKDEPTYDDWDDAVKALDITVNTIIESGARVQIEDDDDDFD